MSVDISILAKSLVSMFCVVVIGFAARKTKVIDRTASKNLSSLILSIGQPFLIISSILSAEYSVENMKTGALILLLGLIVHAASAVVAFVTTAKIKAPDERRMTEFCLIFSNCGFFGFPLLEALYGDIGKFWGAFYIIVFNIICWTYGVFVLSRCGGALKISPKKVLINYGTVPCAIGLALYALRVPVPSPVLSAMTSVGSLCTPISMLIIGGLLADLDAKKLFSDAKTYLFYFVKLIAIPIVCALILKLLRFDRELVVFGTIMAALPAATNSAMFGEKYDICPEYAAGIVGMSTVLSVAAVPAAVLIVERLILR